MSAQHTPGPWMSDGEVVGWLSGDAPAVRVIYEQEPGLWSPVCMVAPHLSGRWKTAGSLHPIEDARLIAAAPDLFEALEDAVKVLDYFCGDEGWTADDSRIAGAARAALAKARVA